MKTTYTALVLLLLSYQQAQAQTFPEKEGGVTTYYRIMSAADDYKGQDRCLEDISSERRTFSYAIKPYSADVKQQEWTLLSESAADETYHLRNRTNYRYISTTLVSTDGMMTPTYNAKKQTADALKFTPIGNDQYTISYTADGDECYFAATDISKPATTVSIRPNTIWAWYVYTSKALQDGIMNPVQLTPRICVRGRKVVVNGAADWQTVDMQGRVLPHDAILQPGIYLITIGNYSTKVLIN